MLQDAGAIRRPSARIILGAAVIDDVLGLVVLAIITGVIQAGSSLGILVPPSVVLVLYGMIARQPVGQLWLAGVCVPFERVTRSVATSGSARAGGTSSSGHLGSTTTTAPTLAGRPSSPAVGSRGR